MTKKTRKIRPLRERFNAKYSVDKESGCWIWTSTVNGSGYGTIGLGTRDQGKGFAHRVSYELHRGPIPSGMVVCHRCDNKLCVNPGHLFTGTQKDNVHDGIQKHRYPTGSAWASEKRLKNKPIGERHGHAKLTESDVRRIRKLFAEGKNKAQLARIFGVSRAMIRFIVERKNWKHVA